MPQFTALSLISSGQYFMFYLCFIYRREKNGTIKNEKKRCKYIIGIYK